MKLKMKTAIHAVQYSAALFLIVEAVSAGCKIGGRFWH
jgi:hypothetical protein